MRICHITINEIHLERRIINQVNTAHRLNYKVWIVAPGLPGQAKRQRKKKYIQWHISLRGLEAGPLKFILFNLKIFFLILFKPLDLIHCHDLWVLPSAAILSILKNCRLVYDAHEYYAGLEIFNNRPMRKKLWLLAEHLFIPVADRVITVSVPIGRLIEKRYRAVDRVAIIRNLPTYETIQIKEKKVKSRKTKLLVFHGHFRPGRGLTNLIHAMALIENVNLHLIGGGELEQELRQLVVEVGLQKRVRFSTYVATDELIAVIADADAGVVLFEPTSLNYMFALPNKFFEYLMAGLPVLGSQIETLQEYIQKYKIGITTDPLNIEKIAEAIRNLFKHEQQFSVWIQNAFEAAKEVNWEKEESKLIDIYRELEV